MFEKQPNTHGNAHWFNNVNNLFISQLPIRISLNSLQYMFVCVYFIKHAADHSRFSFIT